MTTLTIPANVTEIDFLAFGVCDSLEEVIFQGDAPAIHEEAFSEVTATAYYPVDNATWTEDVLQNYDGTIIWIGYECVAPGRDHVESEIIQENIVDAACEKDGSYEAVIYCADCGKELSREVVTIPALIHNYEDGICTNCGGKEPGEEQPDEPTVPSTPIQPTFPNWGEVFEKWFGNWWNSNEETCEHTYTEKVTDPTCSKKGYTTYTCSKCHDSYKDSYVDATGHNYVNNVCEYCGAKKSIGWFDWMFRWFW